MLSPYRRVLSTPGALLFAGTGIVARLPISMVSLGIVVLVESRSGSYGLAGSIAAVYLLANAGLAVVHGRLVDHYGQTRILPLMISVFGSGLTIFIVAVLADWPTWTGYLSAAVAGAALPQVGACVRARWSYVLTNPTQVHTAYAFEGAADEGVFIIGPVLVIVLATAVHPAAGLAAAGVVGVGGTLFFASLRETAPPARRHRPIEPSARRMPWGVVGMVTLLFFALGSLFGAAEVATLAFAEERRATRYAGVLLGLWSLGSLFSGIAVGAIDWRSEPHDRMRWGALALAGSLAPLYYVPSAPVLAAVLFAAGFAISPTLIGAASLVAQSVPASRLSEGLAVMHTGIAAGLAPGAALAGQIIDVYGAAAAYLVALGAGVFGALAAWLTPSAQR
ncbi:MAG: MFS transporter [Nocardioides sp.]